MQTHYVLTKSKYLKFAALELSCFLNTKEGS